MAISWSIANRIPADSRSGVRSGEALAVGQQLGPYEIEARLGQGATSRVYRARGPGGPCALKVLRETLGADRRERFRREGRLAAALAHPGIVRLLDGGELDGLAFLVYELVDGELAFRDWLEQRDLRGRVRALRKVAAALGHAHGRGVVHRDVKLANVLVDREGAIKLTDFGLGMGGDLERLTQSGTVVGTPRTMSPEQLAGSRDLTPASDVWSLGVLLFQALTGEHPFPAAGLVQLRQQIDAEAAPAVRERQPLAPAELSAVVARALERRPEARWRDAQALADALRACEPQVPARPGPALPITKAASGPGARLPLSLGSHEPFELLEVIGRGGMGLVYRARDPLEREVAVKVLLGEQGRRRLERFRREGELTATLQHEHVLRVHGTGVLDEVPYLVYELVPGVRTLGELLDTRDVRGGLRLLRDAARGLGYAHRQGVVHRDVKPENVLVGADARVRVADFGLAAGEGLERLTRTGALVGTPQYMAPELVAGQRERVGPPTDVWALGVILYELLTGQPPFLCDSLVELAAQVTTATEAPSPRALDPAVSPPLDAICRRALAPDPAARYPDGDAFADDVEAYLEGRAVSGRPASLWPWAAAGVIGVVLVAGLLAWVQARGANAGPVAQPTDTPVSADTPAELSDPAGRWRAALGRNDPRAQVDAGLGLLAALPQHPLAGEVREFLRARRYAYRIAVLAHPDGERTWGVFRGDQAWTVSTDRQLVRWSPSGARLGARTLVRFPESNLGMRYDLEALASYPGGVAVGAGYGPLYLLGDDAAPALDERYFGALDLRASPDGAWLGVVTRGGQVALRPLRGQGAPTLLGDMNLPARKIAFSPSGAYVAASSSAELSGNVAESGSLELWRLRDAERLFERSFPSIPRSHVFLDDDVLLVGDSGGRVQMLEVQTGRLVPDAVEFDGRGPGDELRGPFVNRGSVKCMAVVGDVLYTAGNDETRAGYRGALRAWDLHSGKPLIDEVPVRGAPLGLALSADRRALVLSVDGGPAELWGIDVVEIP